jgi:hypothetical protein
MMKLSVMLALAALGSAAAFRAPSTSEVKTARPSTALHAYVPDGMSADQWAKLKDKEKKVKAAKNFGKGGARGFTSRSMASWQEAYEAGEATHLMPVDPAKVKRGEIALKDVPYMQRGGSWDNQDLLKKGKGWQKTGFGMTAFNDGKAKKAKANK